MTRYLRQYEPDACCSRVGVGRQQPLTRPAGASGRATGIRVHVTPINFNQTKNWLQKCSLAGTDPNMSQCIDFMVQTIFLTIYMSEFWDPAAITGCDHSSSLHAKLHSVDP